MSYLTPEPIDTESHQKRSELSHEVRYAAIDQIISVMGFCTAVRGRQ